MLNMNLQIFAHKKGVGSTKNGRDSESKRLGAKRGWKHSLQTAWNQDSSRRERRNRKRRYLIRYG